MKGKITLTMEGTVRIQMRSESETEGVKLATLVKLFNLDYLKAIIRTPAVDVDLVNAVRHGDMNMSVALDFAPKPQTPDEDLDALIAVMRARDLPGIKKSFLALADAARAPKLLEAMREGGER